MFVSPASAILSKAERGRRVVRTFSLNVNTAVSRSLGLQVRAETKPRALHNGLGLCKLLEILGPPSLSPGLKSACLLHGLVSLLMLTAPWPVDKGKREGDPGSEP